jgi:hypothetical protein
MIIVGLRVLPLATRVELEVILEVSEVFKWM